jgi:hypothetical protein
VRAVDCSTRRLVANRSIFAIDRDHATAKIGYRVAPWQRRGRVGSELVAVVTDAWPLTRCPASAQRQRARDISGQRRLGRDTAFWLSPGAGQGRSAAHLGFTMTVLISAMSRIARDYGYTVDELQKL